MDVFILTALVVIGALALKSRDQRGRIVLLASHLGQYQIEKLMENLTQGYLRCLGEDDPERRAQIWNLLNSTEDALGNQFQSFASEFSRLDEAATRVSMLPIALPYASKLFPSATFDLRKAFTMSAELFLMQHTCHWYCKSKTVASARMLARHQTRYEQLIDAVSPETRQAYTALVGR